MWTVSHICSCSSNHANSHSPPLMNGSEKKKWQQRWHESYSHSSVISEAEIKKKNPSVSPPHSTSILSCSWWLMHPLQQPVNEEQVTAISVISGVMCWSTSMRRSESADAAHSTVSVTSEEAGDGGFTDTRDSNWTVTKWSWLMWVKGVTWRTIYLSKKLHTRCLMLNLDLRHKSLLLPRREFDKIRVTEWSVSYWADEWIAKIHF